MVEASFVKVKITPPIGVRLGGYAHRFGRPSTMVHDDLYARMLLLSGKGGEVVLVQVDLLGLYRDDVSKVRSIVSKATGVREDHIFVFSTHTHSGPETAIPMWPNTIPYSEDERSVLTSWFNNMLNAIGEAASRLSGVGRARIRAGYTKAEGLCYNRAFSEGIIDEYVPVMLVESPGSRVAVVSYACHPVCNMDLGISADYPGVLHEELAKAGLESFFITGATGDVDPLSKGRDFMAKIGKSLASAVLGSVDRLKELNQDIDISSHTRMVKVPLRNPPPLDEARARYEEALARVMASGGLPREPGYMRSEHMELLYRDEEYELAKLNMQSSYEEFAVVSVGNTLIVSIPGEPFVESAVRIREYAGGAARFNPNAEKPMVIVAGYANGYVGYIPTREAFLLGTYEATLARWSIVTEDFEGKMIEEVEEAIRAVRRG